MLDAKEEKWMETKGDMAFDMALYAKTRSIKKHAHESRRNVK